jgi:hypothetical protein
MWLRFSNHNHSTYWDGKVSLGAMQVSAFQSGIDALALTDHNTMRGAASTEFHHPPTGMIMVKGMEWNAWNNFGETVVGHACVLGMDGEAPLESGASLETMITEATRRHATIVINHPFCWRYSWAAPTPDARAHAVEVWNGCWDLAKPILNNDQALALWDADLRRGGHLTAVAGTDHHGQFFDDVARNVNMVFAETPDEAGILKGIREGHVTITSGPNDGAVYLEADADGDGVFESMMGDRCARPVSGSVAVRARVLGGQGKQVAFYTGAGRVAVKAVTGVNATIPLTVSLAEGADYVRAELRDNPDLVWSMTSVSNPVYFRSAP